MSSMSSTLLRPTSLLNYPKFHSLSSSSSPGHGLVCHAGSSVSDLKFILHDALDSSGIDTAYARDARKGFSSDIGKLSDIKRSTSISIDRCVDLGKTALYIAAEDDSLVHQSTVTLPVDTFIQVLDALSLDYCSQYSSSFRDSPEKLLNSLETYLYVNKVLMHRSGSVVVLSLIYSEILKMLRLWYLLDFDCEIFCPHDHHALPRGYDKQKSKESDQQNIMTTQILLEKILTDLKEAFWPFRCDNWGSLFLRAAYAANCPGGSTNVGER